MKVTRTLLLLALLACAASWSSTVNADSATACSISVPKVWAGDESGEVYTGHAKGTCNFKWKLEQQIQYKDRWHVLGTTWHGPYAANTTVVVPSDEHDYAPACGWWRVRDVVFDMNGNQRWAGNGSESWFCT